MDTPTPEKIEMFMSITGASETVALQKLEQNRGDLNEAVNAYFNEGDRTRASNPNTHTYIPPQDSDDMEIDNPTNPEFPEPGSQFPSLLSSHGIPDPFSLLDRFPEFTNPAVSRQPRVSREIPIEVKDGNAPAGPSNPSGPIIEEITDLENEGTETHPNATVIIDEPDDINDDNNISNVNNENYEHVGPAPEDNYNNEIEEQMILAAIEASKRDAEGAFNLAEQERVLRATQGIPHGDININSTSDFPELPTESKRAGTSSARTNSESDQEENEDNEDSEEVPLVRHRYPTRRTASGSVQPVVSYQEGPEEDEIADVGEGDDEVEPVVNGSSVIRRRSDARNNQLPADEWGGLSNMEHDEAVMLEAAMFGGLPEGSANYRFSYPHIGGSSSNHGAPPVFPRPRAPPSPGLTEQRLLREQQDDEYLAALQADQEKEMKAIQEREAELQRQKLEEEENNRKQLEQEELERRILDKEASLPAEPSQEDENAITLLVRMPDGARLGRRFLKSDKLKFLFDFIDVARVVKPNSYRLVRPYPRRAFTIGECEQSLSDLGLSSKQEALFLESI
ncbi:hypothetical protein LUZ60_011811 [Juncus effusus]|nr:hypothetical protein LUZ60_011811 [Juncus effusus]